MAAKIGDCLRCGSPVFSTHGVLADGAKKFRDEEAQGVLMACGRCADEVTLPRQD